jgi:hypothetical protein
VAAHPRTRQFVKKLDARYASLAAEVEEDVADYRQLTPDENDAVVSGLARSAMEILRSRPDFAEAMAETDPPAPDYEALMRRLIGRRNR